MSWLLPSILAPARGSSSSTLSSTNGEQSPAETDRPRQRPELHRSASSNKRDLDSRATTDRADTAPPPPKKAKAGLLGTALSLTYDGVVLGSAIAFQAYQSLKEQPAIGDGDNADVDRHLARTRMAKSAAEGKGKQAVKTIELPPPPYQDVDDANDARPRRAPRSRSQRKSMTRRRSSARREEYLTAAADEPRRSTAKGIDSSSPVPSQIPLPSDVDDDLDDSGSNDDDDGDDPDQDAETLELANRIQSLITSGTEALASRAPILPPLPPLSTAPHSTPLPSASSVRASLGSAPVSPSKIPLPASPAAARFGASVRHSGGGGGGGGHARRQSFDPRALRSGKSQIGSPAGTKFNSGGRRGSLTGVEGERRAVDLAAGTSGSAIPRASASGSANGSGSGLRWSSSAKSPTAAAAAEEEDDD